MIAQMTYERGKGRSVKIISMQRGYAVVRRAFDSFLDAENRMTRDEGQSNWIDADRYKITLEGSGRVNGRLCYHLGLAARDNYRFLINGEAWVDQDEYSVVQLKGTTVQNVSFWLGKPDVEEDFEERKGFWLPARSLFSAHVRLAGEADLRIVYSDYLIHACNPSRPAEIR